MPPGLGQRLGSHFIVTRKKQALPEVMEGDFLHPEDGPPTLWRSLAFVALKGPWLVLA